MISLKVLSTAAVMALVIPMAAPTASFAQNFHGNKAAGARGAAHFNGAARFNGGGRGARFGGGGFHRGGGGGFIPGAIAGAVIGGAIASAPYGYYGGPAYAPGYYDDQYGDDGVVAVAPAPEGDDSVAYCMQTYRSYDPRTGSYMGNDGFRHPCP